MQLSLFNEEITWWKCQHYKTWLQQPPGQGQYYYGDCITKTCKCNNAGASPPDPQVIPRKIGFNRDIEN